MTRSVIPRTKSEGSHDASEIQKFEIATLAPLARNDNKVVNSNVLDSKRFVFGILDLDIVSNFDIRISNFKRQRL